MNKLTWGFLIFLLLAVLAYIFYGKDKVNIANPFVDDENEDIDIKKDSKPITPVNNTVSYTEKGFPLSFGSGGANVTKLQIALIGKGANIKADGKFGKNTQSACVNFLGGVTQVSKALFDSLTNTSEESSEETSSDPNINNLLFELYQILCTNVFDDEKRLFSIFRSLTKEQIKQIEKSFYELYDQNIWDCCKMILDENVIFDEFSELKSILYKKGIKI